MLDILLVSHQMSVMSEGEGEIVPVNFMKAYGAVVVLLGEVRGCERCCRLGWQN